MNPPALFTSTGLPILDAFDETLHRVERIVAPEWAPIARDVGLPWQTCHGYAARQQAAYDAGYEAGVLEGLRRAGANS